jgi:VanZ family protein
VRATGSIWSFQVWPAFVYAVLILIFGSLPTAPIGTEGVSDKTLHFLAFGIFAWLSCRALRHLRPRTRELNVALIGFVSSVLLGGLLEIWQSLLSYRSCDVFDWFADAFGAALGVTLSVALHLLLARRAPAA